MIISGSVDFQIEAQIPPPPNIPFSSTDMNKIPDWQPYYSVAFSMSAEMLSYQLACLPEADPHWHSNVIDPWPHLFLRQRLMFYQF